MLRWIAFVSAAALVWAQEPLVRVNTRLVEVDVVVRSKGAPVADLTKADFIVLDQGKPQSIAAFSVLSSATASSGGKHAPLPAGAVSNRLTNLGEEPVSATAVLFDRLNTDIRDQLWAGRQVVKYLSDMRDGERIALYSLGKTLRIIQDYTGDPEKLRKAAARAGAEQSLDMNAIDFITDLPVTGDALTDGMIQAAAKEMTDRAMQNRAEITAFTLEAIAKHLSGMPGRKKLVWITAGFTAQYGDVRSRNGMQQIEIRSFGREIDKAVRALNDANVAVYPIDPRDPYNAGLSATGIDTMNLLAKGTGGVAAYAITDITGAIRKAVDDSEVTYMLGFYPVSEKLDGRFHSLNVKVGRKDVDVRYRKGYYASESKPPNEKQRKVSLSETFGNTLEATAIGITAKAEPQPEGAGLYHLDVNVNVADLHFERENERWVALISLATHFPAKDPPNGTLEEIKITLTEARLKEALSTGFAIRRPVPIGWKIAGDLRVVLQDRVTGTAGSVKLRIGEN